LNTATAKDIVALNKRYLYLVRQMASEQARGVILGVPTAIATQIKQLTQDEIERLAEDMVAPCFAFSFTEKTFRQFCLNSSSEARHAYMTNILLNRKSLDE